MKKSSIAIIVLIAVLAGAFIGVKLYGEKKAQETIDDEIARIAPFASVTYDGVSFNPLTLKTCINDIKIAPNGSTSEYTIRDITVNRYDTSSASPQYVDVMVNGIFLDLKSEAVTGDMAEAAAILAQVGYDSLDIDMGIKYDYAAANKDMDFAYSIKIKDMGAIGFSMGVGNMELSENSMAALLFDYTSLTIRNMRVDYKDDSLTSRIVTMMAKQQGATEEELMEMANSTIDMEIESEEDETGLMVLKAVKKFLNDPKAFVITLTPEQPVSLGEFEKQSPEETLRMMNFNIQI